MRRILVDHARKKLAQKRGGDRKRLDIDSADLAAMSSPSQLLELDELTELDSVAAQLVQLRYFAGQSIDEAAKSLEISIAIAYRHWNYARVWLHGKPIERGES